MEEKNLSEEILGIAKDSGIDVVGFAEAFEFSGYRVPQSKRRAPKLSVPDAKSIIVGGVYIGGMAMEEWDNPLFGRTSRLYLSGFFLDVVQPMKPIAEYLAGKGYQARICDGSAAGGSILPLKLAAVRAGLGWQGKHSLLISKTYGTFLALGGIITDAELEPSGEPEPDRCLRCSACRKACPMDALHEPYLLNREKCLSSLLAEDSLPPEVMAVMGNRVGDCEICQEACPWNKRHMEKPLDTRMTKVFQQKRDEFREIFDLQGLQKISETEYPSVLGGLQTGIPYSIFKRNVDLALENTKTA